jgi:hypothetical protein
MNNLAENNKFIELFEKLYDIIYLGADINEENVGSVDTVELSRSKFKLFKKKEEPVVKAVAPLDIAIQAINDYLESLLSNPSQTFWTLWKLCQFIRWAEKIFIYDNNPESDYTIFVDSEMNESIRKFVIKFTNITIQFKLELIEKPNYTLTEDKYSQVITINVTRDYGKKMNTKLVVVDSEADIADDSDLYLINQINRYVNVAIANTISYIKECIYPKEYNNKVTVKGYYEYHKI